VPGSKYVLDERTYRLLRETAALVDNFMSDVESGGKGFRRVKARLGVELRDLRNTLAHLEAERRRWRRPRAEIDKELKTTTRRIAVARSDRDRIDEVGQHTSLRYICVCAVAASSSSGDRRPRATGVVGFPREATFEGAGKPITLRLDSESQEKVRGVALGHGVSQSEVVRAAIQSYLPKVTSLMARLERDYQDTHLYRIT
jgi:hypothetical protein